MIVKTWDEMGGAAFPVDTHDETPLDAETGMSLRDWFAGQALAGMNASMTTAASWPEKQSSELMAKSAYVQADAMLAARNNV